jgi:hypothetical protein
VYRSGWLICLFIWIIFSECRPEEEIIDFNPDRKLIFSADTVLFDTLFTRIGSITRRLKIYNPNEKALQISRIHVTGGAASPYQIILNGNEQNEFFNETILGKDSLLLLVKVLIDPADQDLPFLVQDTINFITNGNQQKVFLITWGQDAHFIQDSVLACNTVWTSDRPIVVFKNVLIDTLCKLEIDKGTKIYLSNRSNIFIKGTINVKGDSLEPVIFEQVRQDGRFNSLPGQWGGIYFLEGSKDNHLEYVKIRNGDIGLRIGTPDQDTIPDVRIYNVIIENMLTAGILGFTSDILAVNTLIHNCGNWTVANLAGGSYRYIHCTIADYAVNFIRNEPTTVFADNLVLDDQSLLTSDLYLELVNTIVDGNLRNEILLNNNGNAVFTLLIRNSLLKTTLTDLNINDNIINLNPGFKDRFENDFQLDESSPAINAGFQLGIPTDLQGNFRDAQPDIGAFEFLNK